MEVPLDDNLNALTSDPDIFHGVRPSNPYFKGGSITAPKDEQPEVTTQAEVANAFEANIHDYQNNYQKMSSNPYGPGNELPGGNKKKNKKNKKGKGAQYA